MGTPKSVKRRQKAITDAQIALANETAAKQRQLFEALVLPSLSGKPPAFFQNAILPGLEQGFKQAGENLTGFFGSSGQGISGLAAGPMANLESDKVNAMSQALAQSILAGLNTGFQGQAAFNPAPYFSGANASNANLYQMTKSPWASILGGIIGAAGPLFLGGGRGNSAASAMSGEDFMTSLGGYSGPIAAPSAAGLPVNSGLSNVYGWPGVFG